MHTKEEKKQPSIQFNQLPAFAQYLLTQQLHAFCRYQLKLSYQLEVPVLKLIQDIPEEKILELSIESTTEMLTCLTQNNAQQFINNSIEKWLQNQLPNIDKYNVNAQDITLTSYIRKQSFLHFIPGFTSNAEQMLELIREIDFFQLESESALTNTYIKLLQDKIDEHAHFINKINNTIPGAVYVFDVENYKGIYSNNNLGNVIGYDQEELNKLGAAAIGKLIHPEDYASIQESRALITDAKDGEILSYKYRIKNKNGIYRWVRNYEAVFKRAEDGRVIQTIGITLNIEKEEQLSEALVHREKQLLEAQDVANFGSFVWHIANSTLSTGTPKAYEILEVMLGDGKSFIDKVNPAEKNKVLTAYETALQTGIFDCEFKYNGRHTEKVLWSRGIINYENNEPVSITGTVTEITERYRIMEELRHKEQQYKQAEALTHIGNFEWILDTDEIIFSDELKRIYGLNGTETSKPSLVEKISNPKDAAYVQEVFQNAIEQLQHFDFYYRINATAESEIILHARGDVYADENGKAYKIVGTAQDVTEKQKLIRKLQHSEKLYKQAQSLVNLGNWIWEIKNNKVEWSEQMYKIYQLPETEEITFDLVASYIHPEEREEVLQYVEQCIAEGCIYDKSHRIVLHNGEEKIIHRRAEVIYDAEGKPSCLIGTTQDVTDQYDALTQLKEKQNFIQKIADATPSIIASYNINTGKYVFINEGIKKILGYNASSVLEEGAAFIARIIHPDDLPLINEKNQQVITEYNRPDKQNNNNVIAEFSYRMRHANGNYRWFQTYGTIFDRNAQGFIEHILNISLDITDQVEATQKIKEQEYFINHIADSSPTVLYLYNTQTNSIEYINKEIYYVLGYTTDDIISAGANIIELIYHPEDYQLLPERKESDKKFQHHDSMIQYECRMKNKEGSWCWLLVREVIFKSDDEGKVVQILGSALDITKRKEMEKTLLQNSFQLEQSNASLEEFAYVASHDLKEPLRKISTFGDRLVNTQLEKLSDDGKIYLKKIVDASQRMQTMINDLLSISMISGDHSYEQYSLQSILDDALQTLEFKIEQKGAVIKADKLPDANIVPSQFRQLFQNILSNSLKFVKEDETPRINITYTYVQPQEIEHLQLAKANRYLKLEFKDNGIGFEDEYAGKIFAIFQRLHGRSEYEGTGIGLAICKKIAEHHGGAIYAKGAPGEGASFNIILPA